MSERYSPPIKLVNQALGPNEVKFRQRQAARFGRGPALPGSLDYLRACAMVDTALDLNQSVRPLWLDIIAAWNKPGCGAYASWTQANDSLKSYAEQLLSTGGANFSFIARAYNEWQAKFRHDADVIYLNGLIDNFILKAFNGPIKPALINRWIHKARPVPKYKKRVTPDKTRPELKQAIAFLSSCNHEGIDLREVDRQRLGADYDLVTSGKKPTTEQGRKRKPEIKKLVTNANLSFISDKAIYSGAEKWYSARVIRGSIVDATSDFEINNPSTFARLIEDYDRIAGLR